MFRVPNVAGGNITITKGGIMTSSQSWTLSVPTAVPTVAEQELIIVSAWLKERLNECIKEISETTSDAGVYDIIGPVVRLQEIINILDKKKTKTNSYQDNFDAALTELTGLFLLNADPQLTHTAKCYDRAIKNKTDKEQKQPASRKSFLDSFFGGEKAQEQRRIKHERELKEDVPAEQAEFSAVLNQNKYVIDLSRELALILQALYCHFVALQQTPGGALIFGAVNGVKNFRPDHSSAVGLPPRISDAPTPT